ncbi:MAG: DNA polymerase III subunit beta [Acidimicrobiales bacterium]
MRFRCERDTLYDALRTAVRAVSARGGTLPVLSGVKTELSGQELALTGSDLDLTIRASASVAGEEDGAAVVPARLWADIVRALEPGAVSIETDGEHARITAGRSQFSVRLLTVEDFPRHTEPPAERVTLDGVALGEAVQQVVRAASHDNARPILTGVLLAAEGDGLRLVATDSYRLAVRDLPGLSVLAPEQSVLVPSKALQELTGMLSGAEQVTLGLAEWDATFEVGGVRLTTRLIEGDFPNYGQLIPSTVANRLVVGREPLLEAIGRVRLLVQEGAPVRVSLRPGNVELVAMGQDGEAHEDVEAKYEGTEMTIAFNPTYLAEGIDAIRGDEVVIETTEVLKPAVVRSTERDDFLYLVMPVRTG